ncbi:MAG: hypothetical protein ACRD23_06725 [Terriglobales bacterium]
MIFRAASTALISLALALPVCGAATAKSGPKDERRSIVYLSALGVATDGVTDSTSRIQSVLDRNAETGEALEVVLDRGTCLVKTLYLNSNTTLRTLSGARWKAAKGTDGPILRNKHFIKSGVLTGPGHLPQDHDIRVIGGYWDGNARGGSASGKDALVGHGLKYSRLTAVGAYETIMEFVGVVHLTVEDASFYDSPSYGLWLHNCFQFYLSRLDFRIPEENKWVNHDSIHLNGPCAHGYIGNIATNADDDAVALNASDGHQDRVTGAMVQPDREYAGNIGDGPITDIQIENIDLLTSFQGVRCLSGFPADRIDRIFIENVHGSNTSFPILLDQFDFSQGEIGRISIKDVDVQMVARDARLAGLHYEASAVRIDVANAEDISISNLTRNNPVDRRSMVLVMPAARVHVLTVCGITSVDTRGGGEGGDIIKVDGRIDRLIVTRANLNLTHAPAALITLAGEINYLIVTDSILPAPVLGGLHASSIPAAHKLIANNLVIEGHQGSTH